MTAPMTAAEYRRSTGFLTERGNRVLAALEEREALLGERAEWSVQTARQIGEVTQRHQEEVSRKGAAITDLVEQNEALKSDASVGALVRRIREHDMRGLSQYRCPMTAEAFTKEIDYLDSLLPKEPEVVTGKSGRNYRRHAGSVQARVDYMGEPSHWVDAQAVPVVDAPVVAKLMEGRDNG